MALDPVLTTESRAVTAGSAITQMTGGGGNPTLNPIGQVATTLVRRLDDIALASTDAVRLCGENVSRICLLVDCEDGSDFQLSLAPLAAPALSATGGGLRNPMVIHSAIFSTACSLTWYVSGLTGKTIRVWEIENNEG